MKKNTVDITNLSDDALDVFLRIKGGEDGVDVEHLTAAERYDVCEALGVKCPTWFLHSTPSADFPAGRPRVVGPDFEAMILDRQDEQFGE